MTSYPDQTRNVNVQVPTPRRVQAVAELTGRHVRLRPLKPDDYGYLFDLATGSESLLRWRHRGIVPPPEQFPQLLWQGTFVQFVVVRKDDGQALGLVQSYDADFRHDFVSLALLIAPEYEQQGWALEAAGVLLNFLFTCWRFRKVYIDSLELAVWKFWSGEGQFFEVEGCLRDHEYHDGRYWHLYKLAIYRDQWIANASRVLVPPSNLDGTPCS